MDVSLANLGKNTICLCNKVVEYAFLSQSESTIIAATTANENPDVSVWHQRLGRAPMSKLQHIACIPKMNGKLDCCLTCPLAKFIKLPYSLRKKHRPRPFWLIHMDILGPYRKVTQGRYRYFVTIVDDCSSAAWTLLI